MRMRFHFRYSLPAARLHSRPRKVPAKRGVRSNIKVAARNTNPIIIQALLTFTLHALRTLGRNPAFGILFTAPQAIKHLYTPIVINSNPLQ